MNPAGVFIYNFSKCCKHVTVYDKTSCKNITVNFIFLDNIRFKLAGIVDHSRKINGPNILSS